MAPLLRRTWARRGHAPEIIQEGRRQKVSIAAAIWISPYRRRLGLFYRTLEKEYFNNLRVVGFLRALLHRLPGKIILIWDGSTNHKGDPIRDFLKLYGRRITLEKLPPYAPMLNPVEPLWQWLKYGRLCNFAAHTKHELNRKAVARLNAIAKNQKRLLNFLAASDLPKL